MKLNHLFLYPHYSEAAKVISDLTYISILAERFMTYELTRKGLKYEAFSCFRASILSILTTTALSEPLHTRPKILACAHLTLRFVYWRLILRLLNAQQNYVNVLIAAPFGYYYSLKYMLFDSEKNLTKVRLVQIDQSSHLTQRNRSTSLRSLGPIVFANLSANPPQEKPLASI
tara:strand:+ start:73 stop:591 length:519 start_codon:yes stop_codon:yes gene_type:complete